MWFLDSFWFGFFVLGFVALCQIVLVKRIGVFRGLLIPITPLIVFVIVWLCISK